MRNKLTFFCLFSLWILNLDAQERVTTFGIQFKPIIPIGLLNTGKQEITQNNIGFSINPQLGLSFGMVIRKGLTKTLSFESGINYLTRKYELTITDPLFDLNDKSTFKLVSYEIPVSLLVYIRLSEKIYMNVSGGVALDAYPSNLYTYSDNFQNDVLMYNWLRTSLIANIGWEYRTDKSGYIYFGGSYHRPFSNMSKEMIWYNGNKRDEKVEFFLSGNYITVDLRYFFHEDAEKKARKAKKPTPKIINE